MSHDPAHKGTTSEEPSLFRQPAFVSYLGASSAQQFSYAMQQLLVAWLLIGVVHSSTGAVGVAQAMIGGPALIAMLWGGARSDSGDPRLLLMWVYGWMTLIPWLLVIANETQTVNFWTVALWGMLLGIANAYATPAQTALLNKSAGRRVQAAVAAATGFGFAMQVLGLLLGGQLDRIGLSTVLVVQSAVLAFGFYMTFRLPPGEVVRAPGQSTLKQIREGLQAVLDHELLRSVLILNFASMMFNAGSFTLVLPFVMTLIYGGDAQFLATMLVVFWGGGVASNFLIMKISPIPALGKVFLFMQVSRAVLFLLVWIEPPLTVLVVVIFLWGFNMGVTTAISRAMIQEAADESVRGRVLSIYQIGSLGAMPLGASLLGLITHYVGILNGLLPGVCVSLLIFVIGFTRTPIAGFTSSETRNASA